MERGQGWHRITADEWSKATQYMDYDFYDDGTVCYEEPYKGTFMTRAEMARIGRMFPKADHAVLVFRDSDSEDDSEFQTIKRTFEGNTDPGPDAEYVMFVLYYKLRSFSHGRIFIHPLVDDYFIVDFRDMDLTEDYEDDFEFRPIYKCDQIRGVANLLRDKPWDNLFS
jgi:hypothetical protein